MVEVPQDISQLTEAQLDALLNLDKPRGTRNNNPGNIEDGPFAKSLPGYAGSDGRFALFDTPDNGRNAAYKLFQRYGEGGKNTVAKVVATWAPPGENDTQAYIESVAQTLGVGVSDPLNMNDPAVQAALFDAINGVENGGQSGDISQASDEELNLSLFGARGTQDDPINLSRLTQAQAALLDKGMWAAEEGGQPYQLPTGPMLDFQRPNDKPQPGGAIIRPQTASEDFGRSLNTGLLEGAAATAGVIGDIEGLFGAGSAALGRSLGLSEEQLAEIRQKQQGGLLAQFPSSEDVNKTIQGAAGDYYDPQTMAGEYGRTLGQFAPAALSPGGLLGRASSVAVPAVASETAGQLTEGTKAEPLARLAGALLGAGVTGGVQSVRGGDQRIISRATEGVTPEQLAMAAQLRQNSPIPLTNAEALQQVTNGTTGLSRVQRLVEGRTNQLGPMMSERPQAVRGAFDDLLNQIGSPVAPEAAAGAGRQAAEDVLTTMRKRVNESARPAYDRLPGQTVSPEDLAVLQANPSYAKAAAAIEADPELAALITGGPEDISTINRVIEQLDQMESAATPAFTNPTGNKTLASQRGQASGLARELASAASPDFAQARQTVATGREAFVNPLERGPIGAIRQQGEVRPNLEGQTGALFPATPAEGSAAQTRLALELMGEVNPQAGQGLTRQYLATEGNRALRDLSGGPNQFGGANLASRLAGTPEQRDTLMGALEVVSPQARDQADTLIEALRATGQRERAGSQTSFNTEMLGDLRGGNMGQAAVGAVSNPTGVLNRLGGAWDDFVVERNARKLGDLLLADPEEFAHALRRSRRETGGNRIRLGVSASQSQEDQ